MLLYAYVTITLEKNPAHSIIYIRAMHLKYSNLENKQFSVQ